MKFVLPGAQATWRLRIFVVGLAGVTAGLLVACSDKAEQAATTPAESALAAPAALTVTVATPQQADWPQQLALDGNVTAWQEAVIGTELGQFRITAVHVQVGDRVKRGQLLASLDDVAVRAEYEDAQAMVQELDAYADEAKANAQRAQTLREQGFYSPQTSTQFVTGERATLARVSGARARLEAAEWRLQRTQIHATDDGVISARNATVGSLTQPGQELFRLIRGGRIEWQAEAPAQLLHRVKPGQAAEVEGPEGATVSGQVRTVSPSVDPRTRNGMVYVDLPVNQAQAASLRAGMYAHGQIELGRAPAMTVPAVSVLLREGHAYVFVVAGDSSRAKLVRVKTGRRYQDRVEILEGLDSQARIVDSGAGFLADGDVVSVVAAGAANPANPVNQSAPTDATQQTQAASQS
jgi:RND family efflux transporter MFP subunit